MTYREELLASAPASALLSARRAAVWKLRLAEKIDRDNARTKAEHKAIDRKVVDLAQWLPG
jgi:hypothetical protein